jgi:acetyl-CoA acetyltransferase
VTQAERLAALGLSRGDRVRFRRLETQRWKEAVVTGVERDGSIGLADAKGAARAIAVGLIEVRVAGPRGGITWVPMAEWIRRTEQLRLL